MFNKKYEDRLREWNLFRKTLETSLNPLQDAIDFYNQAPMVSIQVDPWDTDSWLNPWELLYENQYCDFSKILAICYSLQLTERFMAEDFEIHIYTNNKESKTIYLLLVQDKVIGYDGFKTVNRKNLPSDLQPQKTYIMPKLT